MKKLVILLIIIIFSFNACGKASKNNREENITANNQKISQNNNENNIKRKESSILVVYFSLPEEDDNNKANGSEAEDSSVVINGIKMGNTEYLAKLIQEKTESDIFRIETKKVYPINDHQKLIDMATEERKSNFRPELKNNIGDISKYDTIFIGYPIWWADMPMALYTFLENTDLSGKKIIPFNTHGGSRLVNTVDTIKKLQPKATVDSDAVSIHRREVENAKPLVDKWLEKQGY